MMGEADTPITVEILREFLHYDPETGVLTWKHRDASWFKTEGSFKTWNTRWACKPAFTYLNILGYRQGAILSKNYFAHRVAYAIHTGEWPENVIDHCDHDRSNNRFDNLFDVTRQDNQRNMRMNKRNTSGHIGVSWDRRMKKWQARIVMDGRTKNLGYFTDMTDAIASRSAANAKHGFHANHGRVSE